MATEKRLIDLDRVLEPYKAAAILDPYEYIPPLMIVKDLEFQPIVDAVEVVRCKDCQHYETKHLCIPGGALGRTYEIGYCYYWKYETGESPNSVEADDFCSYGEKKANADPEGEIDFDYSAED